MRFAKDWVGESTEKELRAVLGNSIGARAGIESTEKELRAYAPAIAVIKYLQNPQRRNCEISRYLPYSYHCVWESTEKELRDSSDEPGYDETRWESTEKELRA